MRSTGIALTSLLCLIFALTADAYDAPHAAVAPAIDGVADDDAWHAAPWHAIDQLTLGPQPSASDFTGRFKIVWTADRLHLLAEITDDVLIDSHADPLDSYWEDDTLELFLDEDASGGDHLDNYNAFAYHIALDNQAIDRSSTGTPRTLNDHVQSAWRRQPGEGRAIVWEASFAVYPDTFTDTDNTARPVRLTSGKVLGFLVAYCDSDSPEGREHFLGSHDVPAVRGDKNRAYIDASVFGRLTLVE